MRAPGRDLSRFWPGTMLAGTSGIVPNVVVERSFDAPVRFEELEALGDAKTRCLERHGVKRTHSAFALDGKRLLCFYTAPDADAVRRVQIEIGAPFSAVWAGVALGPEQSSA
jgi:hypothetical protein